MRVGGGQQRSGRGARRGSAPKSSGGMYRNGRGVQGGYDVTGYPANRGYSGGGYPRGTALSSPCREWGLLTVCVVLYNSYLFV